MKLLRSIVCLLLLVLATSLHAQAGSTVSLVGVWKLTAANKILPDGKEVADYGADPHGLVVFTSDGQYMVEIYRADRMKFAGNDRAKGSAEEYKDASLSTSVHFGQYSVDSADGKIQFHVDRASFPNWDGTTRVASFQLQGDKLSWKTPARPDGSIPTTYLQRIK
jgi:hypothetical protein